MPRARGGNVQGKPGTAYPNRSDLRAAEPVEVAPAAQYGERQQQQSAQRAIPLAAPPVGAPTPPPGPPGAPQGAAPQQPVAQGPTNRFPPTPPGGPGVLPWMHPSNRPNEPLTAGMATGPGPGPEALTGVGAVAQNGGVEQGTLKNLLGTLANSPVSSSEIRDLAAVAGAG